MDKESVTFGTNDEAIKKQADEIVEAMRKAEKENEIYQPHDFSKDVGKER